jgi:uroporphyrinogen-III decarboxylase
MTDILSVEAQIDYLAEKIRARAKQGKMTPLQRNICLVTKQTPDRMPIFALSVEWGAHYVGYQINQDFVSDPKKLTHAALACVDRLEADICAPLLDVYIVGCDAMGAEIYFHEDSFPEIIDPPVKSPADLKKLKVPDPHKDGRLPVMIEATRLCQERVGDVVPILASCNAPFSWAANLRGIYNFLADLKRDPQFAHALLEITTAAVKEVVKAYLELGFQSILLADATCTTYLVSPAQMEEFGAKYYMKLQDELGAGAFVGSLFGDYATQARMVKMGIPNFLGINNYCYCQAGERLREEDILEGKRVARELGVPLVINLWGRWVQVHSAKEIDEEVKRVIELAGPEWPYMVGMWNIPVPCPVESVDAFVRAIKKYGTFA